MYYKIKDNKFWTIGKIIAISTLFILAIGGTDLLICLN